MGSGEQPTTTGRPVGDASLHSESVRVERKHFSFDLRENPRGRFLRITEEVSGRFDTVIVPASGLEEFRDAIDKTIQFNQTLPPAP